jgi:hypothetical protein
MLSGGDQDTPEAYQSGAVELESRNRRPASRRKAEDESGVITPGEVITPALFAWMEQGDNAARRRIGAIDMRIFMIITTLARHGQVLPGGSAFSAARGDVLDREWLHSEPRLAAAVLAATAGAAPDVSSRLRRKTRLSHRKAC